MSSANEAGNRFQDLAYKKRCLTSPLQILSGSWINDIFTSKDPRPQHLQVEYEVEEQTEAQTEKTSKILRSTKKIDPGAGIRAELKESFEEEPAAASRGRKRIRKGTDLIVTHNIRCLFLGRDGC